MNKFERAEPKAPNFKFMNKKIAIKIKTEGGKFSTLATNPDQFLSALQAGDFQVNSAGNRNLVREIWDALAAGELEVQSV